MTATIHPTPTKGDALDLARYVARRPHLYSDPALLDACAILDDHGDWYDAQTAMHLRRVIHAKAEALDAPEDARSESEDSDTLAANAQADLIMLIVLCISALGGVMWWLS